MKTKEGWRFEKLGTTRKVSLIKTETRRQMKRKAPVFTADVVSDGDALAAPPNGGCFVIICCKWWPLCG
jgi:hypothetical protein